MRSRLSPGATAALALLAAFTVFITWRAKGLEKRLAGRSETPALLSKKAPDFALTALDGRTVTLAEYHGKKKLVLNFWASWCGPCRMEMPVLREFYEKNRKHADKFEMLAISIDDDRAAAESMATAMKLPFPVLLDWRSEAANAYGVEAIPTMFVIDENGTVIYAHTGFNQMVEFQLGAELGLTKLDVKDAGAADGGASH